MTPPPFRERDAHEAWLAAETTRLLRFGRGAALPDGGFGWLGVDGTPSSPSPAPLYVQARLVHCYSLGDLLGFPDSERLVGHGVRALDNHWDHAGGWVTRLQPPDPGKDGYAHAFVLLAATSMTAAGLTAGPRLLDRALEVLESRFWDESTGLLRERWDSTFTTPSAYRGANANMHYVEALLAAGAVTGDNTWWGRAEDITRFFLRRAAEHDLRLPEHYDDRLRPMLDHNKDSPHDPVRPYGSTIGHWFEWSRLALQVSAVSSQDDQRTGGEIRELAARLFDRAVIEGWTDEPSAGFHYTVDWFGAPVVRQRLHWVLCEALQAAISWWQATQDSRYIDLYDRWWRLAEAAFIDRQNGSWHHELDPWNHPAASVRPGKADLYHALHATLLPRLPPGPSLAVQLARACSGTTPGEWLPD